MISARDSARDPVARESSELIGRRFAGISRGRERKLLHIYRREIDKMVEGRLDAGREIGRVSFVFLKEIEREREAFPREYKLFVLERGREVYGLI